MFRRILKATARRPKGWNSSDMGAGNLAVASLAKEYTLNAILIEDQASGSPLIAECLRKGMIGIIPRRPTTDKRTRMNGETAKLEAGSLIFPKSAPWLDEFLEEYRAFPGGKHDDQMDALSQFLNWRPWACWHNSSTAFGRAWLPTGKGDRGGSRRPSGCGRDG
jgi:predicted phage terminase large subunit-like protein